MKTHAISVYQKAVESALTSIMHSSFKDLRSTPAFPSDKNALKHSVFSVQGFAGLDSYVHVGELFVMTGSGSLDAYDMFCRFPLG